MATIAIGRYLVLALSLLAGTAVAQVAVEEPSRLGQTRADTVQLTRIHSLKLDRGTRRPTQIGIVPSRSEICVRSAVSRGFDVGGLTIWDFRTGRVLSSSDLQHPGGLLSVPYPIKWWVTQTGVSLETIPNGAVREIKTKERTKRIVAASLEHKLIVDQRADNSLFIIATDSRLVTQELSTDVLIEATALSDNGKLIAAIGIPQDVWKNANPRRCDFTSYMHVWDVKSGRMLVTRRLAFHARIARFTGANSHLVCCGGVDGDRWEASEGRVEVVSLEKPAWSRHYRTSSFVNSACFVDKTSLAIGLREGTIQLVDLELENSIASVDAHDGEVRGLASHEELIFSCGSDGQVCVWQSSDSAD